MGVRDYVMALIRHYRWCYTNGDEEIEPPGHQDTRKYPGDWESSPLHHLYRLEHPEHRPAQMRSKCHQSERHGCVDADRGDYQEEMRLVREVGDQKERDEEEALPDRPP